MTVAEEAHCRRYLVSGRVQGVHYRAATRAHAQGLAITGFAANLPDGRVEVVACGLQSALTALEIWLWQGPPSAAVTSIDMSAYPAMQFPDFQVH